MRKKGKLTNVWFYLTAGKDLHIHYPAGQTRAAYIKGGNFTKFLSEGLVKLICYNIKNILTGVEMAEKKKRVRKPVVKKKNGRPRIWEEPEDMIADLAKYAEHCEETGEVPFMISFCAWKKIAEDTLIEYAKKPGFSEPVKKLKSACEGTLVQKAIDGGNASACMFLLKNIRPDKYRERKEVEITTNNADEDLADFISKKRKK